MNIQPMVLEVNMPKVSPGQNLQKTNEKKSDDPFSSVLSKTQEKQENQKDDKVGNDKTGTTSKSSPKEETTNVTKKDPLKSVSTKEASNLEGGIQEESIPVEEVTIEAIANLLQITPEQLEQLLAALKIGLSDLLQGDNLQQLLMQVHHVDEPMDLLLIPEVASQMKVVTSVLEEHMANNLEILADAVQLEQPLEIKVDENLLGVSVSSSNNNSQGNAKGDMDNTTKVLDENNNPLDVAQASTSKISAPVENDENLGQNEEGTTPNQNHATNQFLETLTHSIGEAFQMQSEHVTDVKEALVGRHEVVNPKMVLDQIVERIKVSTLAEEAQMNIQLKPEHLGKLSMEVVSKQGIMTAHFTVENEKTKALLEQNIQDLKETLESKGLVIQQLEVTVEQNQQDDRETYKNTRSNKNISDMINRMMNEDMLEEEIDLQRHRENDTNEVDFIA